MDDSTTDDNNINALEMSDEDFLKTDPSQFEESIVSNDTDDSVNGDDSADANADAGTDDSGANDDGDGDVNTDPPLDDENEGSGDSDTNDTDSSDSADDDQENNQKDPDNKQDNIDNSTDADDKKFADIGRQIMGEFKANGTTMKMKSVEDAIQLMQMGANYHKKMTGLKPSLKTLKLLENNGLLDPDKINFLIDVHNKKPEAITQLLKDSKIDPMAIDMDTESNYTPDQHTVSDTEIVLDDILESIAESPNYNKTLNVLGTEWDDTSRETIVASPEIIRTINVHMDNGIYDQVMENVAYERSLGKLQGVSDLEAYQRIGTYMHENKMFRTNEMSQHVDNTNHQESQTQNTNQDAAKEAQRKSRKKAASPSRHKQVAQKDEKYNPLSMSDEEFIKMNKLSL